ncbi:hypothetical protein CNMCM5793_008082 [Aspergillus hiratsukae]|uniref:ATP-dependent rRNA helicase RRP3 n=1 Tax=Aspergillus hiratsukae TaxID=1194566 RepID=A0A8H6P747_9EURO|nr:hypothetical protein CNMCM5793_008082 [Aspergillus hiratsukae]KAF7166930.1 hypothetical protein CNMCM6106_002545 [Aspergillus hiratsukae]
MKVISPRCEISSNYSNHSASLRGSGTQDPPRTFRDLGLLEPLCEACDSMGYRTPTLIQAHSIPVALQGRDLICLAETGSGKTAAFVLPILQALMNRPQPLNSLVLAPTRELALQISQVVEDLGALISVRCAVLIGGVDMVSQAMALGKKPHIIVATPGRLLDHLEHTKGFSLRYLKCLVLDEADRLLDLDFGPILGRILKILPTRTRTTFLFSATMSNKVETLQRAALSNPIRVSDSDSASTTRQRGTVSTLLQSYTFLPLKYKDLYLVHLLNDRAGQTGIIFTGTLTRRRESRSCCARLDSLRFRSTANSLRMCDWRRGKSRNLLIATDVAARGLDIPSVDLVINYDLPSDSKTYIHRVGRAAQAGRSGVAMSLVTQYDVEVWLRIEEALGKKLDELKIPISDVLVFAERVGEAQRVAMREMRNLQRKQGNLGSALRGKKSGKRKRDDMDRDEL